MINQLQIWLYFFEHFFGLLLEIVSANLNLDTKESARDWFNNLRLSTLDWNSVEWNSEEFKRHEQNIRSLLAAKKVGCDTNALKFLQMYGVRD